MASQIQPSNPSQTSLLSPNKRPDATAPNQQGSSTPPTVNPTQAERAPSEPASSRFQPSAQGLQAMAMQSQYEASMAYSHTMTLSLETKQGDQVQVDFRQLFAQYQSYQQQQSAESGPQGARLFESREAMEATAFEERFGFAVQGALNEDETQAIFKVFEQVGDLADEFFNGDIEKAFEQAQGLQVDFGQLKSMDLNLEKTQTQAQRYQQTQAYQQGESPSPSVGDKEAQGMLGELPAYLQQWQSVIEQMDEQFANARESFDQLMGQVLAQKESPAQPKASAESSMAAPSDLKALQSEQTPQSSASMTEPSQQSAAGKTEDWAARVGAFHDRLAQASQLDQWMRTPPQAPSA